MIERGMTAPDFIAPAVSDGTAVEVELFRLVERHRAVVLAFAPATFVPAPTAELLAIRDAGWADHADVAVVAVTGDSLFAGFAYADRYDLPFPIVSDFHGGVADSYDLLADEWEAHSKIPRRATVVLGSDWTVRFASATADPHDRADPAPITAATAALADLDIDVDRPVVDYDAV
ncbi:redoxin domain-containing protein [Halorubrum vacuolatum]|uniref:Peroxiredoxin Q/BCP n=1 Tax=Halorubrum vacuolatum TaxID=63740 RepID=A0A238XIG8_HALVU|nr:redoxin domain-containing protein [Halorubrum vacuolatum]SNR58510.1 peroxiredoxin Q/BCP [Halorubrum vacuolatum]